MSNESKKVINDAKKAEQKAEKNIEKAASDAKEIGNEAAHTIAAKAEEIKEAAIEAASDVVDAVTPKAQEFAAEAKKEFEHVSEKAKELSETYSDKLVKVVQDPAVSTTILFTSVTATAASTYLAQQHKQGKLSALVATGVVVGIAALSVAEYFSVKAYFRKNSSTKP